MLSASYTLLGIEIENGELRLRDDAFLTKGDIKLEYVIFKGKKHSE
jgi:cyclic beta-1,2-glucan synthetase